MKEKFTFFWKSESVFSNWYLANFELEGIQYNCVEQYMMYQKALLFDDTEIAEKILQTKKQGAQKALGRQVSKFNDDVWRANCKQIVYDGNRAKFLQNENLLKRLLKTRKTTLVEASPVDAIWGIGLSEHDPKAHIRAKWRGKNWLGEVLTNLREDLMKEGYGEYK